ncbi:MAG: DUF1080 domain-containing protein [Acidobacteria bacterium]|nr:DUF1080 domain-containing protein [Acidobacteriota bacterium]
MKQVSAIALALALFGLTSLAQPTTVLAQAGGGWKTLLAGTNMDGWNPIGMANWRVVDGAVQSDNGMGGFLVSKDSYGDFELRADVWVTPDANSGIFIRCGNPKEVTAMNAYEVNIYDMRPDQTYRTGGIVDIAKPTSVINTGNKWNTLEITAKGSRLIVRLNGTQTVDVMDTKHARGPIALQAGIGTVKFRNVQIR